MFCRKCGAQNRDGAKFCCKCGQPLAAARVDANSDGLAKEGAGAQNSPREDSTAQPAPAAEAFAMPSAQADGHGASATGTSAAGGSQNGVLAKFRAFIGSKKGRMVAGVAVAVVVVAVVAFVVIFNAGPSNGFAENYLKSSKFAADYGNIDKTTTYFTPSEDLFTVSTVEVKSNEKVASSASSYPVYKITAEVKGSNGPVNVSKTVLLTVAKPRGSKEWSVVGSSDSDVSYSPNGGLDKSIIESDVKGGITGKGTSKVLTAEAGNSWSNTTLANYYSGGEVSVSDGEFDDHALTDTFTIGLKRNAALASASATVTAKLTFDTSRAIWVLDGATSDDAAYSQSFQGLIGTYTAEFKSMSSPTRKCFGGKQHAPKLTITSVDDATRKITGKLSYLAHYHEQSENDEDSDSGDVYMSEQDFSCVINPNYSIDKRWASSLGGSYSFAEVEQGSVNVSFSFNLDSGDGTLSLETRAKSNALFISTVYYSEQFTFTKDV